MSDESGNFQTIEELEAQLQALHSDKSETNQELEELRKSVDALEAELRALQASQAERTIQEAKKSVESANTALETVTPSAARNVSTPTSKPVESKSTEDVAIQSSNTSSASPGDMASFAVTLKNMEAQIASLVSEKQDLEQVHQHSKKRLERVANLIASLVAGAIME